MPPNISHEIQLKLPRRASLRCGCSDAGLAVYAKNLYLCSMLKVFHFCIPTRGTEVPSAPDWLHEIKHDGYRYATAIACG